MTCHCFDREVNVAITAVREATPIVLEVYRHDFGVELKHAREPVTIADRKVNALLCQRFATAFPEDGIVAEESVPASASELAAIVARPRVWFIDPLDGTKEFIARNGEFAIMIGLAVGGRAVLGVVATPVTGEVFAGVVGHGAWLLHDDGNRTPLRVSDVNSLGSAGLVKSRSHRSGKLQRVIDALGVQRQVVSG
ncbi:MAG: 3'(2'),5'-bisphosphate nucleotidase CysQ, partial [Polyangiaceae bacterium]|nr:3'(2'),5'-bisphosphate nucleotidase CysQ [Polyangiaceae bacterium]